MIENHMSTCVNDQSATTLELTGQSVGFLNKSLLLIQVHHQSCLADDIYCKSICFGSLHRFSILQIAYFTPTELCI